MSDEICEGLQKLETSWFQDVLQLQLIQINREQPFYCKGTETCAQKGKQKFATRKDL
jgi:hypothetical protein